MNPLSATYFTAVKASIAASEKIMEIYEGDFETIEKEDGSPLTIADLASTKVIHSYLDPLGIPVTGEETEKMDYSERQHWTLSWCVDPLDGTKEFISRNGEFAVNIAMIENGNAIFGVIASPVYREVLFGGKSTGVFISSFENIENPSTWQGLEATQSVNDPLCLISSRSHKSEAQTALENELKETYPTLNYLMRGSAIKFFALAKGEADIYPRYAPTMEWDIAAGQAILEALGGDVLSAEDQLPLRYNKPNLLNPFFVARTKALAVLQNA